MIKKSKKWIERNYSNEWKTKVKERDNYCCQVCGKKLIGINCQAHHIIPKQFKEFKYDIMNGITLCYSHHKVGKQSAHLNALWFVYWLSTYKNNQFNYLWEKVK